MEKPEPMSTKDWEAFCRLCKMYGVDMDSQSYDEAADEVMAAVMNEVKGQ